MNDSRAKILERAADIIRTMESEWMTPWIVAGTVRAVIRSEHPERKGDLPDILRGIADGIRARDGGRGRDGRDDAECIEDWTARACGRAAPEAAIADLLDAVAAGRERGPDGPDPERPRDGPDRPEGPAAAGVSDRDVFDVFREYRGSGVNWHVPFLDWLRSEAREAERGGDAGRAGILGAVDGLLADAEDAIGDAISPHAVGILGEAEGIAAVAAWRGEVAEERRARALGNSAAGAAIALARGFGIDRGRRVGWTEHERVWDTLSAEIARAGAPLDGRAWEHGRECLHDWLHVHARPRSDQPETDDPGGMEPEEPEEPLRTGRRAGTARGRSPGM